MQPPLTARLCIALASLCAPLAASAQVDVQLIRPNVMVLCDAVCDWVWTPDAQPHDVTGDVHIVSGLFSPLRAGLIESSQIVNSPLTPEETARWSYRMHARGIEAFDWPVDNPITWEATLFDAAGSDRGIEDHEAYTRECLQIEHPQLTHTFWRAPLASLAPLRRTAATRVVFDDDACAGPFGAVIST